MPRGGFREHWTAEELQVIDQLIDSNPDKAEIGNWKPLVMEFYANAPDYSARTKKAIREKFRLVKMTREEKEQQAEEERQRAEEQRKKQEQEKKDVQNALRMDKEVKRLHEELMKETARVLKSYNMIVDAAILFADQVYKDTAGHERLRFNLRELDNVLRSLEPDLYQLRIDELNGK